MDDREEQIKHAASEYTKGIIGWSVDKAISFERGAEWADNNPKFINMEQKEIIIPQGWVNVGNLIGQVQIKINIA